MHDSVCRHTVQFSGCFRSQNPSFLVYFFIITSVFVTRIIRDSIKLSWNSINLTIGFWKSIQKTSHMILQLQCVTSKSHVLKDFTYSRSKLEKIYAYERPFLQVRLRLRLIYLSKYNDNIKWKIFSCKKKHWIETKYAILAPNKTWKNTVWSQGGSHIFKIGEARLVGMFPWVARKMGRRGGMHMLLTTLKMPNLGALSKCLQDRNQSVYQSGCLFTTVSNLGIT